jgi:hypothetical protein
LSIRLKDHIPTFSSITAVGASSGDKAFSPKTDTPIPAIARLHMDSRFIHKLHFLWTQAKWAGCYTPIVAGASS